MRDRSKYDLLPDYILGAASILSILIVWEVLVRKGILPQNSISSPLRTFQVIYQDLGSLLVELLWTLGSAATGFTLAFLIAVPTAYLMAQSAAINKLLKPIVEFLRPLPSSVMILVFAVLLGIGWPSELAVVAFGSLWPLLINTYDGLINIPRSTRDILKLLKLTRWHELRFVYSRIVLPNLASGIRIAASIAIILAVTFEILLGGTRGLGQYLSQAMNVGDTDSLYAGVVVAGVGGLIVNAFVARVCSTLTQRYGR